VKGDFRCHQKKLADGSWVNHGRFVQLQPDGRTIALEGQFVDGVRTGKWIQYSEQGKPLAELFFDSRGVQKTGVPPPEAEPPLKTEPQKKVRE
jgi:antitoxin component YwqK of YwqJK toxin-antitoxin module